jgi:hypothetical protein
VSASGRKATRSGIIVAVRDPGYLRILEHQVRGELASGRIPLVIDTNATGAAPVDTYDRSTLRLFGLKYPGHDLRERIEALGADYVAVEMPGPFDPSEQLNVELEDSLAIAVQSALISYFRTDQPNRSHRRVAHIASGLEREGRVVYRAVSALLGEHSEIDRIYVPNGRYPGQKMATLAAEDAGLTTLHFEKGETPNGTYLQDYAPQNRLKSQGSVDQVLTGLSEHEIDAIAEEWLTRRAPAVDSRNEFAALWKGGVPETLRARLGTGPRVMGLFTSSQDEFQFLGPDWQLHEWLDQFEAFDRILFEAEATGRIAYLRVHPNLATKAQDCFRREREGIRQLAQRHPNLVVIWHDESVSTYALLDITDDVVVWDSTVGLEASARGLPVWTTATSRYGLVADVKERLSPKAVDELGLDPWTVDRHAANRFIAYLVRRDQQMSEDYKTWFPWDPANPPLATKLALALVSGGTPYRREAVKSILDVYRHRSLKANLSHLRGA